MTKFARFIARYPLAPWGAVAAGLFLFAISGLRDYWFRYESLGWAYVFGHPALALQEYFQPESIPYLSQLFLYPWQFKLFGYQPFGFLALSVGMAVIATVISFRTLQKMGVPFVALVIALLFTASALFGIETLSWEPTNGFQNYYVITLMFGTLWSLDTYRRTARPKVLILGLFLYAIALAFSQFRSFLLPIPIILYLLFSKWGKSSTRRLLIVVCTALALGAFAPGLVWGRTFSEQGLSAFPVFEIIAAAFGNVGASFAPLDQWRPPPALYSILGFLLISGSLIYWWKKRTLKIGSLIGYLALVAIGNALVMQVMVRFTGSEPMVYSNTHRFLTFTTIFTFPLLGLIGQGLFTRRFPKTIQVLFALFLAGLITAQTFQARTAIAARAQETGQIKQFYVGLKNTVPTLGEGAVLQTIAAAPRFTIDPFTNNQFGRTEYGLAGFYHMDADNLYLTHTSAQSSEILRERGWGLDKLFVVTFSKQGVNDISLSARALMRNGAEFSLTKSPLHTRFDPLVSRAEPLIISPLRLPAYQPFMLTFRAKVTAQNTEVKNATVPIWWQPQGSAQWLERWKTELTIPADGMWHSYTVAIVPDEGVEIAALKFGDIREVVELEIDDISARYDLVNVP